MNDTTYGNVNLSGTAKALLQKLRGGDLTMAEFLRECAYWTLKDGFDEIRVKPFPSKPNSEAFKDFYMLPYVRRLKVDPVTFLRNPEILSYFEQVRRVRDMNKSCFEWLKEIRGYIPVEDAVCMDKINSRIQDFQDCIDQENDMVESAKRNFGTSVEMLA